VLRNGRVIAGAITRLGDRYLVTLGDTGEIRLPAEQVEMICDSLTQAYLTKRASIRVLDADAHLDLAQWCFNHAKTDKTMVAAAADEILSAMSKDKLNPRIAQLERRLSLMTQSRVRKPVVVSAPTSYIDTNAIDRALRGISEETTKSFVSKIQPILFNRCANPACHGVQAKNDFRLVRLSVGKNPTMRITRRNLYITLKQIDRKNPDASPLVEFAARAHGTMATSVIGPRDQDKIEILAAWAKQTKPVEIPVEAPEEVKQGNQNLANTFLKTFDTPTNVANKPPTAEKPKDDSDSTGFAPKDPFDAEVFNRRYFKR